MSSSDSLKMTTAPTRSIYDPAGGLNFVVLCLIQGSTFPAMRLARPKAMT
jgi:hypothetical protein